ncbi:MAG TPA: hypothetical protein VFS36_02165 [Chitinophagaceae bacterium]|jgi:hypothetical protein|nr:hypothetical protein [Chitinophagaceae bacterium]
MTRKISTSLALVLLCLTTILSPSCKKTNDAADNPDLYKNSPSSAIPDDLIGGLWFWGGLGPISYYDRDGHEVGNGTEAARQYSFSEVEGQGRFEFLQYLGIRNASNCVTEIYTTKKGTVKFEGEDKLTFYPVEGSFKTVKNGCAENGTSTRKAEGNDLKQETYLWKVAFFDGGGRFYIYNENDVEKQNPIFIYLLAR